MNNTSLVMNVLQDINADIAENKPSCKIMSFEDYWLRKHHASDADFDKISFINDLTMLENTEKPNYYSELSSYKPGLSAIVIFVKKCIRKLLKFLIYPMVQQQNIINSQNIRLGQHIRAFINYQEDNGKTVAILSNKILTNQFNIETINEQLSYMNEEIKTLREENQKLKEQINKAGGQE